MGDGKLRLWVIACRLRLFQRKTPLPPDRATPSPTPLGGQQFSTASAHLKAINIAEAEYEVVQPAFLC